MTISFSLCTVFNMSSGNLAGKGNDRAVICYYPIDTHSQMYVAFARDDARFFISSRVHQAISRFMLFNGHH
jgi:hypothetical protein